MDSLETSKPSVQPLDGSILNTNISRANTFSMNESLDEYCFNFFSGRLALSAEESYAIAAIFALLMPLTLVTNICVIRFLIQTKKLGKISYYLIFILSLSDLSIGLIVLSLDIIILTVYRSQRVCKFELAAQFVSSMTAHISGQMILVIAFDRVLHLKKVNKYNSIMSKTKAIIFVMMVVFSSIVIAVALCVSSLTGHFFTTGLVITLLDMTLVNIALFVYVKTYYNVWSFVRNSRLWKSLRGRKNQATSQQNPQGTKPEYLSRLANIIFFILLAICLCYLPYILLSLYMFMMEFMHAEPIPKLASFALFLSYTLVYANSTMNAVIFLWKNGRCDCSSKNNQQISTEQGNSGAITHKSGADVAVLLVE